MNISIAANGLMNVPNRHFLFGNDNEAKNNSDKHIGVEHAYSISISKEGRDRLRESVSKNPINIEKDRRQREIWSKSQIDLTGTIETKFHEKFIHLNTERVTGSMGVKDEADFFAQNLLTVYADMYDEIKKGYADGTREIYIPDSDAEFGYRRATEEEEIAALDEAFDFHAMYTDAYIKFLSEDAEYLSTAIQKQQERLRVAREKQFADLEKAEYYNRYYEKLREKVENTKPINFNQIMKDSRDYFKAHYSAEGNSDLLNSLFGKIHTQIYS
ncbi:MAG: hypothetical protein K6A61_06010 [Butyrivibrio sp.]|nr:hypothetical protein [Butyrivibrio sp.]